MSLPRHHPPQDVLLEYASGTATPTTCLVVACHLTLCPPCRRDVARLEDVAGGLLEQQSEAALAPGSLERIMAALDVPVVQARARLAPSDTPLGLLPRPLLEALPNGQMKLRRLLPGVQAVRTLVDCDPSCARLFLFQPGVRIPEHDHEGPEFVLVLQGELEEGEQRFARGDVAYCHGGQQHQQTIANSGPCLALVVNEGKIQPTTLWGKLLKRVAGL